MELHKMIESIRGQVVRASKEAEYQAVRAECPAMAPFAELASFASSLPFAASVEHEVRHEIATAMLRAYAGRPAKSFWSSLLTMAMEPMLAAVCGDAVRLPKGEREQVVLAAFMEAVRAGSEHAHLASATGFLARYTRMQVVHQFSLDAEQNRLVEHVEFDDELTVADASSIFESPVERVYAARERIDAALKRRATKAAALKSPIAEVFAGEDPDARRRAYRRAMYARPGAAERRSELHRVSKQKKSSKQVSS